LPHTPLVDAVPDLDALVREVEARSTRAHGMHGPQHWQAVARVGAELIEVGEPANPAVVFLFALLHDSQRLHDRHDSEHGARAAAVAREMAGTWFHLSDGELAQLCEACARHAAGGRSSDATIGVCFDADRLNLGRVGIRPSPALLSTMSAREPDRIAHCSDRCHERAEWRALYERYAALPICEVARSITPEIFYHGSDHSNLEEIRRHGLRERRRGYGIYLTPDRDLALWYVKCRDSRHLTADMKRVKETWKDAQRRNVTHIEEAGATYVAAIRDIARRMQSPVTLGVLVTVKMPPDFPFKYRDDGPFGYCADVACIPPEYAKAEEVRVRAEDIARYGNFRMSRPAFTADERASWADERNDWAGWPHG
jgi:uncharacterized protein